ncbi:hypothetical protein ACFC6L_23735, partial [Kitasatospora phosalacinea]
MITFNARPCTNRSGCPRHPATARNATPTRPPAATRSNHPNNTRTNFFSGRPDTTPAASPNSPSPNNPAPSNTTNDSNPNPATTESPSNNANNARRLSASSPT